MDLNILLIVLFVATSLLFVGAFRKQYLFVIFSGLFFILGGLFVLNGITYVNGQSEDYSYMCTVCGTPSRNYSICAGVADSCDTYDGNEPSCTLYGCIYDNETGFCTGNPQECGTITDLTVCGRIGCDIETIVTNGTAAVNETVLTNKTVIYRYSTWGTIFKIPISISLLMLGLLFVIIGILSTVGNSDNASVYNSEEEE